MSVRKGAANPIEFVDSSYPRRTGPASPIYATNPDFLTGSFGGGPFLPLSGGTMTGDITFNAGQPGLLINADNVHVVESSGIGDYTTVSAAIAAASSGDTILVMNNISDTSFTLDNNIKIVGISPGVTVTLSGTVTITGSGGELHNITLQRFMPGASALVTLNNNGVTFIASGLTISFPFGAGLNVAVGGAGIIISYSTFNSIQTPGGTFTHCNLGSVTIDQSVSASDIFNVIVSIATTITLNNISNPTRITFNACSVQSITASPSISGFQMYQGVIDGTISGITSFDAGTAQGSNIQI